MQCHTGGEYNKRCKTVEGGREKRQYEMNIGFPSVMLQAVISGKIQ